MRALIIDDNPLSRELLSHCIREYADIDVAENGQTALELVAKTLEKGINYDLIFVDLNMPVMDGHETMQTFRALENNAGVARATVIMVTASNNPDDMIKAISEGKCDDYLMKPVMRNSIIEILRKHSLIK